MTLEMYELYLKHQLEKKKKLEELFKLLDNEEPEK